VSEHTPQTKNRRTPTQRLFANVDIPAGQPNACWEWQASRTRFGYGQISIDGQRWTGHRAFYTLFYGPIPDGAWILHACDNPACCNPLHLGAGTPSENSQQRDARGRRVILRGEDTSWNRLTKTDVLEIRRLYRSTDLTQRELGERFGVSQSSVSNIVNFKEWKHLEATND